MLLLLSLLSLFTVLVVIVWFAYFKFFYEWLDMILIGDASRVFWWYGRSVVRWFGGSCSFLIHCFVCILAYVGTGR